MPVADYIALSIRASRLLARADDQIARGGYREAAATAGEAVEVLTQAANERAMALGFENPANIVETQLRASLDQLRDDAA